jgi:hypothetical protein
MMKANQTGKIFVALGVLHLFRRVDGGYGYGGYYDNAWGILSISLSLITIGVFMLLVNRERSKEK